MSPCLRMGPWQSGWLATTYETLWIDVWNLATLTDAPIFKKTFPATSKTVGFVKVISSPVHEPFLYAYALKSGFNSTFDFFTLAETASFNVTELAPIRKVEPGFNGIEVLYDLEIAYSPRGDACYAYSYLDNLKSVATYLGFGKSLSRSPTSLQSSFLLLIFPPLTRFKWILPPQIASSALRACPLILNSSFRP